MKRFLIALSIVAGGSSMLGTAQAYEEGKAYVAVDVARPDIVIYSGSFNGVNRFGSGDPQREEAELTIGNLRVGYQMFENLGFEVIYGQSFEDAEIQDASVQGDDGQPVILDGTIEVDNYYGIYARASTLAFSWLRVNAILGHTWADFTLEFDDEGVPDNATPFDSNKETFRGFSFGFGFDFVLNDVFSAGINYLHYVDETSGDDEGARLNGLSANLTVSLNGF